MTINTSLLIAAPMLQDYLVDKDTGLPLANGIVTLYKDTSRSYYKNWYYQTGSPGAYSWVALDNPLRLSSVGTIQDPEGNDVIPFYYPYEETNENVQEAYYITVYSADSNGDPAVLQFTRENFPYNATPVTPTSNFPTYRNYILNNVYWRNAGNLTLTNETDKIIAPSQHDGYTNGDIRFIKNVTGAIDTITFTKMTETLSNDITPEYYLEFQCASVQAGETVKCIQYPVCLHIDTLKNVSATLVMQAQNVAGNANNYVDLYVYQFTGTGAATQPAPILIQRLTLNNSFTKYTIPFIFPDSNGVAVGTGGDDALFIRVQYPLSAVSHINHTKPQLYLSADVPDDNFDTYDEIEAIINSPRTGDVRFSMNAFEPYGYVLVNDGVLSNSGSITPPTNIPVARANIDAWPLYNLLWNSTNTVVCPIFDSTGASTTRGGSAIADWSANKQLQLSLTLGRSLLGLPPAISVTYDRATTPTWGSVAGVFTAVSTTLLYVGAPVYLTGTMPTGGNFVANTVYYAIPAIDGSDTITFQLATTYANALAGTAIAAGAAADNGTDLVTNFALGGAFGQSRHVQLVGEIGAHTHPMTYDGVTQVSSDVNALDVAGGNATTTGSAGLSYPFNIVQPSVYYNVFLKL